MASRSARAAERIRGAALRPDIELVVAPDGALTGTIGVPPRQLASLRAPLAEGEKLAQSVDIAASAAVVVRGFGLGHHVAALARRLKQHGAIMVFEPDVELLRAVLERVDCTVWLKVCNVAFLTEAEDTGAIASAASGIEAILAAGTILVDHAPSRPRLGDLGDRFAQQFTNVMKAVRTNVVTTLVQVDVTVQNLLQNLAWYATVPGVADLAGVAKGKPAVIVAAGPSLRRNIDLLTRPGVRDQVVIIAVQTVLKTLLSKGIKPHFVTALDYHEISRRFYEGLTTEDVEGVTLVAEPKCNRAILEAFPGSVRCARDGVLDQVLGPGLARPMGELQPGATVAHLAYYLARHMGCDPVILMGQDLGFTDGQYYAPGAAIHQVWSGELNDFNTLEMLEWQRIARMRSLLRKVTDHDGRPIYTDEQMSTYLVQFERDFMHDAARGFTTIDATEGGVLKKHTTVMSLEAALSRYARSSAALLPPTPARLGLERLGAVGARLDALRQSAGRIVRIGHDAAGLLESMLAHQQDHARVDTLIARVQKLGRGAIAENAYWLVQYINQTGQFNRFRADRAIHIDPAMPAMERQKREIERDLINVRWLADAAVHVGELLTDAAAALTLGCPHKVGAAAARIAGTQTDAGPQLPQVITPSGGVWAVIPADMSIGGLGTERDLHQVFMQGKNALRLTLERLALCRGLAGVVLLCPDIDAARRAAGTPVPNLQVEFEGVDGRILREYGARVGAARLWGRHCWRGGIANLSCYDEAFCPALLAPVMESRGIDAAVILGADWALVDPELVDAVIARHLERPDANQLTFTQAPPGLGACLVTRSVVAELAAAASPLATIGGLLGYLPLAPQADPIAKTACIQAEPRVRDLLVRCIPDSPARLAGLRALLGPLWEAGAQPAAADISDALIAAPSPSFGLEMVVLDARGACAGLDAGVTSQSFGELSRDVAVEIIEGNLAPSDVARLVELARGAGAAGIHVRTGLRGGAEHAQALLDSGVRVISVDVLAENRETYEALTGVDCFEQVRAGLDRLLAGRGPGLPEVWVVPRIMRRDAVYEQVEDFYNRSLMGTGAAVIDALPQAIPGERITPLPLPPNVVRRRAGSTVIISTNGAVRSGDGTMLGNIRERPLAAILHGAGLVPAVAGALAHSHHRTQPLTLGQATPALSIAS